MPNYIEPYADMIGSPPPADLKEDLDRSLHNEVVKGTGIYRIENFLTREQAFEARDESKRLLEVSQPHQYRGRDGRLYIEDLFRSSVFRDIAARPFFLETLQLFSDELVLGSYVVHQISPDASDLHLHQDYPYGTPSLEKAKNLLPILCLEMIIALDDFTDENGATILIPNSHSFGVEMAHSAQQILWKAKAGDLVVVHGRIWHGTPTNKTENTRSAILFAFNPRWIRPVDNSVKLYQECPQALIDLAYGVQKKNVYGAK